MNCNKQWYPWLNVVYHQILDYCCKYKGYHYALLLHSNQNNGENYLINAIIRWLFCSHPNKSRSCDICYDCMLMNSGNHPDFYRFDLKNGKVSIGIDTVRSCIDEIYRSTHQGRIKVLYIEYIELLNNFAVNALLKVIEEPPINTYFFFKTQKCIKIPATLLSRCIKWYVNIPNESYGVKWLLQNTKNKDVLTIISALRFCDGSPIEAEIMLKKSVWSRRLQLYQIVSDVVVNGFFLKLLPFLRNDENHILLRCLITLLLDSLKWRLKVKKKFLINLDQLHLINIIATNCNIFSLKNQLNQWIILFNYFQIFTNVNCELLLACRLLNWERDIIELYFDSWSV